MKLYWRYKKDGKWTWRSAKNFRQCERTKSYIVDWEEEE